MSDFDPNKLISNRIYGNSINEQVGQVHMTTIEENSSEIIYENVYYPLSTKYYVKALYKKVNGEIGDITIEKLANGAKVKEQRITFNDFSLQHIVTFLNFIVTCDLAPIVNKTLRVDLDSNTINSKLINTLGKIENTDKVQEMLDALISNANINKLDILKSLLNNDDATELVKNILSSEGITSADIVNIGYRRKQLKIFEEMLKNCDDEKEYQKFFEQNQWIFGFGLDYKFNQILQREFSTGSQGLGDKGDSHGDFILSDSKFAVLVELKTPNTALFGSDKYRNGCWRISTDLADVTSQMLSQKHEVSLNFDRLNQDNDNDVDLYDPKAIIVIGHTKQFNSDCKKESRWKKRTFELYRRNLRNVEIITYDELYERAKFIVENGK